MRRTALLLAWLLPATVSAQTIAGAAYTRSSFSRDWTDWALLTIHAGRKWESGALIGQVFRSERFAQRDHGVGLDAYHQLWRRAYGNATLLVAPGADAIARLDGALEVYQGIRGGWDASAGIRRMQFAADHANIGTASLGKYIGRFYFNGRTFVVPKADETGVTLVGTARYQTRREAFAELKAGSGDELVTVAAGPLISVRASEFVALRAQHETLFSSRVGLQAGAGRYWIRGIPRRTELQFGVLLAF